MSSVVLQNKPYRGNCNNCDLEDDECDDFISGDKLTPPVYKTVTTRQCYNKDTMTKLYSEKNPSDPFTRAPLIPHPDFLNKFEVSKITKLVRSGELENARKLFLETIRYVDRFSIPRIERLFRVGMEDEAHDLFRRTLEFDTKRGEHSEYVIAIERLLRIGMEDQARELFQSLMTSLFTRGEVLSTVSLLDYITRLYTAGLMNEAGILFDQYRQTHFEFDASVIATLFNVGMKQNAYGLFYKMFQRATKLSLDDIGLLSRAGMENEARTLFSATLHTRQAREFSTDDITRLVMLDMKSEARELFTTMSLSHEAHKFSIDDITRLVKLDMKSEARELFTAMLDGLSRNAREKTLSDGEFEYDEQGIEFLSYEALRLNALEDAQRLEDLNAPSQLSRLGLYDESTRLRQYIDDILTNSADDSFIPESSFLSESDEEDV